MRFNLKSTYLFVVMLIALGQVSCTDAPGALDEAELQQNQAQVQLMHSLMLQFADKNAKLIDQVIRSNLKNADIIKKLFSNIDTFVNNDAPKFLKSIVTVDDQAELNELIVRLAPVLKEYIELELVKHLTIQAVVYQKTQNGNRIQVKK